MKLPKWLTSATSFSRTLSATFFVTFPLIAFYLGIEYQNLIYSSYESTAKPQTLITQLAKEDYSKRCGPIPHEKLNIQTSPLTVVFGPMWSPDCQHIAWSIWETGAVLFGEKGLQSQNPLMEEGVYVYTLPSESIQKVYAPHTNGELVNISNWKDNNTILFNGNFSYDLRTDELSFTKDHYTFLVETKTMNITNGSTVTVSSITDKGLKRCLSPNELRVEITTIPLDRIFSSSQAMVYDDFFVLNNQYWFDRKKRTDGTGLPNRTFRLTTVAGKNAVEEKVVWTQTYECDDKTEYVYFVPLNSTLKEILEIRFSFLTYSTKNFQNDIRRFLNNFII